MDTDNSAEMSPWSANQLEFAPVDQQANVLTLWSRQEAFFVHSQAASQAVLWGCDMDEFQPQLLIRDLSRANPKNPILARMVDITKAGYQRKMAPELLELARQLTNIPDLPIDDVSLAQNVRATLEIETDRLNPDTRLSA